MFSTIFETDWLESYRRELKELLGDPERGNLENSDLWILLCALDDIHNGLISDVTYEYADGEEGDEPTPYRHSQVPIPVKSWNVALSDGVINSFFESSEDK